MKPEEKTECEKVQAFLIGVAFLMLICACLMAFIKADPLGLAACSAILLYITTK